MAATIWLTSHLCIGPVPPGITGLIPVTSADQAAQVVISGGTALLPAAALKQARQAMLLMGASQRQVEQAVALGTTGRLL